jgi:hypothetical protein
MGVEGTRSTKNPKTRRIRELLDHEKGRVKLMWIPLWPACRSATPLTEHPSIHVDTVKAKNNLEEDINDRELYPPQDLTNWMKNNDAKNRQERWAQGEKTMRFRKETIE